MHVGTAKVHPDGEAPLTAREVRVLPGGKPQASVEFVSSADAILSPGQPKARNIFAARTSATGPLVPTPFIGARVNTSITSLLDQGSGRFSAPWSARLTAQHRSSTADRPSDTHPQPTLQAYQQGGAGSWAQQALCRFKQWRPRAIPMDDYWYEKWTWLCVAGAVLTAFVAPFLMAFEGSPGFDAETWSLIQWILIAIFFLDMASHFFVEYEDQDTGMKVTDMQQIALHYVKGMLLPDIMFLIPWYTVVNAALPIDDPEDTTILLVGLLRLLQLGRLYRLSAFVAMLEYRMILPQTALVVLRNNMYVLGSSHVAGCLFYLLGRIQRFTPETWIGRHGERFDGVGIFGKYIYSLYFALAAFTGLGDNDFYIASVAEACVMAGYLLFNLLLAAYILGTVTMLMVKGDKRMKQFRDRVTNLRAYGKLNDVPDRLMKAMEAHTELHFHNEQASDEQVLSIYPQTIRRRVLRHLYADSIRQCYLFTGCSASFVDAILSCGRVEQFMPQEQMVSLGDMVNEVYIILEGQAVVTLDKNPPKGMAGGVGVQQSGASKRALSTAALKRSKTAGQLALKASQTSGFDPNRSGHFEISVRQQSTAGWSQRSERTTISLNGVPTIKHRLHEVSSASPPIHSLMRRSDSQASFTNTELGGESVASVSRAPPVTLAVPVGGTELQAGSCFGQVSFFAEIPSYCSVWSTSVIKVLALSRSMYKELLSTYPQQTRKMLENVERSAEEEVQMEILNTLMVPGKQLSPEVSRAVHDLAMGSRKPSDLPSSTLYEIRNMLDKPKRALIDDLGKVKDSLAHYVRKVNQDVISEFLNSCHSGEENNVRTMLASGISPNVVDYDRRTGLMLACRSGHEGVVRALLEAGADPQLTDIFGGTAMLECVRQRHDKLIEVLLEFGGSLGMAGSAMASQLCELIQTGDLVQLEAMLRAGAPATLADYTGTTPLHVAVLTSNLTAAKMLVAEGAVSLMARNVWGRTALEEAIQLGDTNMINFLEPLTQAAHNKEEVKVKHMEFLQWCSSGDMEQVRTALASGVSPDTADYDNRTGLMLACHAGHLHVAKLLLQAGAEPDIKDFAGHTAMWDAVQMEHAHMVDLLLQYGGSLGMSGPELSCTMSQMVADRRLELLRTLIRAGAQPEELDYTGSTPLHVAASLGDLESVRLLVEEADALVDVVDVFDRTALDCALSCANLGRVEAEEIVLYLQPLVEAAQQGLIRSTNNPLGPPALMLAKRFNADQPATGPRLGPARPQGIAAVPMPAFTANYSRSPEASGRSQEPGLHKPPRKVTHVPPPLVVDLSGVSEERDQVLRLSEDAQDTFNTAFAPRVVPSPSKRLSRKFSLRRGASPVPLLELARLSNEAPAPAAAAQNVIETVHRDLDGLLEVEFLRSRSSVARRQNKSISGVQLPDGAMVSLHGDAAVNTAAVKRVRRASVQLVESAAAELAALATSFQQQPGDDISLKQKRSTGTGATLSQRASVNERSSSVSQAMPEQSEAGDASPFSAGLPAARSGRSSVAAIYDEER